MCNGKKEGKGKELLPKVESLTPQYLDQIGIFIYLEFDVFEVTSEGRAVLNPMYF